MQVPSEFSDFWTLESFYSLVFDLMNFVLRLLLLFPKVNRILELPFTLYFSFNILFMLFPSLDTSSIGLNIAMWLVGMYFLPEICDKGGLDFLLILLFGVTF